MEVLERGVKEVSETGSLSFPTRRALWLALGPWEERDEMDNRPRTLTKSLQKRARLALDSARKAAKVWEAYAPEDKKPQMLVKQGYAYLSGKLTADELSRAWQEVDYMNQMEKERYSFAPMAAIAAERAVVVALYDEDLLEPRYADADDYDFDSYDWDAAWCASLAWAGQNEEAGPGERNVAELKFWVWYLEQVSGLLGLEDWKFPKKAIKAFKEKQELARPVPEEVSLESLTDFMGQGEYRCHYRIRKNFNDETSSGDEDCEYVIYTKRRKAEGICPKCRTHVTKAEFWYTVNMLNTRLPGNAVFIQVNHTLPMFHCPNHTDISFVPYEGYINPKAALKRYLKEPGRLQALLDQLERRQENVFEIGEGCLTLNGEIDDHHQIRIPTGMRGIRWLDTEAKEVVLDMKELGRTSYMTGMTEERLEIDLKQFCARLYFADLTLDEFRAVYPDQVEVLEDGCVQLTMEWHWVRCWLDEAGSLERVVIQSRFHLEVDAQSPVTLTNFLMQTFHLSENQAKAEVAASPRRSEERPYQSGSPFTNLTRAEALCLRSELRSWRIKCRIMPVPMGEAGDTELR